MPDEPGEIQTSVASCEQDFDTMVRQAFEDLPTEYREACRDLSIRIEALASPEIMSALHLANPYQLLGSLSRDKLGQEKHLQRANAAE